jgi:hypothetical protein
MKISDMKIIKYSFAEIMAIIVQESVVNFISNIVNIWLRDALLLKADFQQAEKMLGKSKFFLRVELVLFRPSGFPDP